ncbi:hypothetical protein ACEPAH_4746 [Sanghuangporus vaninii]
MSAKCIRRIGKDMQDLEADPIAGVYAAPKSESDLRSWHGFMEGTSDTPYKGGKFNFELDFPEDFPFKPPVFKFTTRIYHPGINEQGQVCLGILRDEWRPSMTLKSVLAAIQEKLNNPKVDDPFEPDIALVLKDNPAQFNITAAEWTKKRKSDAKRTELPASAPAYSVASTSRPHPPFPIITQHVQIHPPLDPPSLPPESDFRTSLIFPDLARRFTLLRASSGTPYSLDDLRNRFAEQRAKGADNQISEEEEDMLLDMLSKIRAHGAGFASKATKASAPEEPTSSIVRSEQSSSSISSNDAGSSTSSTVRQSTQSSATMSSGTGSDPSFSPSSPSSRSSKRHSNNLFAGNQLRDMRYMRKSSNRTISSSRSALSSTQSESTTENIANALIDSYSEGNLRPSTPESNNTPTASPSSSPVSATLTRSRNLSDSSAVDDGLGSLPAPSALRLSRQLTSVQIQRMSMSLEEAIKRIEEDTIEEEADDQVLVPRTPQQNGIAAVVDEGSRPLAVTTDDNNSSPPLPITEPTIQSSTMTWLADEDTSGPAGAYHSQSPHRAGRSASPAPRVPGYIPGMPRPVTPHRDVDLEDVRSLSTTPRAAASSAAQDRTTTSSPQYPSPTSSLLRQAVNTSPTPYGARPKSPHSSVRDRHGNPRNGSEHTSLNSHWRRPSSPLSSNNTAFQSLNGGSRPSTPSNVTWNVPGRESTQSYRPLGRNGTLLGHSRNPSNSSVGESPNRVEDSNDETTHNGLRSPRPVYSPATSSDGGGPEIRPKFLSSNSVLSTSALAFVDFDPTSEHSSFRGSDSSPSRDLARSTSVSSTIDDKTRNKQRVVSPLLTPPTSPYAQKHSSSSLFIPPTSDNSSRSSLVSVGSSYHSTEDDGAKFVYSPERAEPAWHDVPTAADNGAARTRFSSQVLAVDDPANILRQFTGLTKLDLITIQGKLLDAAEARSRNSEVRAPSTLRRRRPSTAASVHSIGGQQSRTTSPAPTSGLPFTSNAESTAKANALLNTVVDSIPAPELMEHERDASDDTEVQTVPPSAPFLAPIPTSSPGRRNKDLAEILFGSSEPEPVPTLPEPEPEPVSSQEPGQNAGEQDRLDVSRPSPVTSKDEDNVRPISDRGANMTSDNVHFADHNDLIRQVQERTEAAMAQLRRSPQQGRFPTSSPHIAKKKINLQDISGPLLVQSSTSIDKIPTIPTSPLNPAHNESQRSVKMSFSRRLRNTLRSKNVHPNGEEVTPWALDNTSSSFTSSPQVGNRSLTPSKASTTDLNAHSKPSNVSPPASAGPNLKSFMSRFRKRGQPTSPMEHEHKNNSSSAISSNTPSLSVSANGRRSFQLAPSSVPLLSRSGSVSHAFARDGPTAPSLSRQPTETPTITASSSSPAPSPPEPAVLKQFFEAAQNLGLDQSTLDEILARAQPPTRRDFETTVTGNRGDLSAEEPSGRPARPYSPVIPEVFIERPIADLSRSTSARQLAGSPLPPAAPRRVREIADAHGNARSTVLRRTLILPSTNGSTTDLASLSRKPTTKSYKRASNVSVQSNRSVHERIPTPPPSKAKRQSIEPSPPVPSLPSPLSLSNSGRFSSSRLTPETPVEKSPYDSFYDMYTGDRTASAQSPELYEPPRTPLDEGLPEMEEGQALEVIELANGETIWSIVNGLRAEDAESYYPRRGSLDSEYSNLPTHDSESEQLFFKEHERTGSKDSNISTYARRKSRVAARPETKVFHSSSAQIARLIEQLARNTEAATFNIKPKASHVPGHSHSGSLQTESDVNWTVEERLDRMLASVNPSQ